MGRKKKNTTDQWDEIIRKPIHKTGGKGVLRVELPKHLMEALELDLRVAGRGWSIVERVDKPGEYELRLSMQKIQGKTLKERVKEEKEKL